MIRMKIRALLLEMMLSTIKLVATNNPGEKEAAKMINGLADNYALKIINLLIKEMEAL
jgi:hypothetical protein